MGLLDDTVQVVDLYSTTPAIRAESAGVLEDPRNMILAQQVYISIHAAGSRLRAEVNRVSAKLNA